MNELLATLSAAHFGAFTTNDAHDCGYHGQSLSQLVRRRQALRVGPSVYIDRDRYDAASPERRHEMATRAVARADDSLTRRGALPDAGPVITLRRTAAT